MARVEDKSVSIMQYRFKFIVFRLLYVYILAKLPTAPIAFYRVYISYTHHQISSDLCNAQLNAYQPKRTKARYFRAISMPHFALLRHVLTHFIFIGNVWQRVTLRGEKVIAKANSARPRGLVTNSQH